MEEIDDKQIGNFLAAGKREIPENGFTRRVMRRLPDRSRRLSQVWTACAFVLATVLFVVFDGVQMLGNALRETFRNVVADEALSIDPKALMVAVAVLFYLGCHKLLAEEG